MGEDQVKRASQGRRRVWIAIGVVGGAVGIVVLGLFALLVDQFLTGSSAYAYPPDPLVPAGRTAVLSDRSWDDDDPIRITLLVLDAGQTPQADVVSAHRSAFPEAQGWAAFPYDQSVVCLVRIDGDVVETVELWPYTGTRVPAHDGMYLAMRTRMYLRGGAPAAPVPDMCGHGLGWVSTDLF